MVGKRYVDVNVFVYWLGKHPRFGIRAYEWMRKIESTPRREYMTSSLTLYESLIIISGLTGKTLKDKHLVEAVVTPIMSLKGLAVEPVSSSDFAQAIAFMEDYDLDYEDSLHLAVAIRTGANEIVSNDKDFERTPLKTTF